MSLSEETAPPSAPVQRFPATARWGVAIALGVLIAIAFVMVRNRIADPTPPLTTETFDTAWARWQARGPKNYEIQIRVNGTQPATYRVVVVEGDAREAYRNQHPLQQRRTFETWSVPGMFSTIEADLTRLAKPPPGTAPPRLSLRAEFDPELGYPRKYRRIEWGKPTEVSWEVERFTTTD